MKHESFIIKKDIDTTFKIIIDSLQKVGTLKKQDNDNYKIEGIVWYGLQRIKVFITLNSEKKSTDVNIKASSDDVLEIGASKSIQKLIDEIASSSKTTKKSQSENSKNTNYSNKKTPFQLNYKILLTFFIAIIFIWVIFFSNKTTDNSYYTKSGFGATYNEQDFDLLLSCSVKNDVQCIQSMIISGTAIELSAGTKVYIVESTFTGGIIIRPEGKSYNLWTVKEAITK
jgi:hypothetical protein